MTCLEYPRLLGRELGLETELSRNAKQNCSSRLGARELKLGDLLSLATKSWATSSDLQLSLSTSFNHNSSRWDCLPRVYKWDSPVLRDAILFEMRLCLHLASGGYQQIRRNCDRKKKDNNKEVHCKEVTRAGAAWTATGCEQTTPSGNFGKNWVASLNLQLSSSTSFNHNVSRSEIALQDFTNGTVQFLEMQSSSK